MAQKDTKVITDKMFAEMVDDFLVRKMVQEDIAAKFGIKKTRLKYLFKLAGIKIRDKDNPYWHIDKSQQEIEKLVIEMNKTEKSANKIGMKLNISKHVVLRIIKENKLKHTGTKNIWTEKRKKEYIAEYIKNGVEFVMKKYNLTSKYYANEKFYEFREQYGWNPKL